MNRTAVATVAALLAASTAAAEPLVLVDEGHAQQFLIGRDGELDLSRFGGELRSRGASLETVREALDAARLEGASALVLSGPFLPLSDEEVDAVIAFVEGGGRLAVMLHIGPPVAALLDRLGVSVSNGVIRESDGVLAGDPINFQVRNLQRHALFSGLDSFAVFGGWALLPHGQGVRALAETGPHAWIDLNSSDRYDDGDAMQKFAVVVGGRRGEGSFLIFADDAMFQNRFLGAVGDNLKLTGNLAEWLLGRAADGERMARLRPPGEPGAAAAGPG